MSQPEIVDQANRIAKKMEEEVYYSLNLRIGMIEHASPGVLDTLEHLLDLIKEDRKPARGKEAAADV
jgi:hypothetical protein